jgi:excisionase family DNA binding protein
MATTDGERAPSNSRRPVPDEKKLLTYAQVAEMIGVDVRTVRQWRAAGKLKVIRISYKVVRIRPEEVERFIARHERR